jgi:hypothetical protein
MTTRISALMVALAAAGVLAARPAAAQTDTAAAAAPAAAPAGTPVPATAPAARPRRNPNLVTRAEMQERNARDVLDGVRALRPSWLRASRALTSANDKVPEVMVYRDGAFLGTAPGALRGMAVESVSSVQYFAPTLAVQRFGGDASGGAIMVNSGSGG